MVTGINRLDTSNGYAINDIRLSTGFKKSFDKFGIKLGSFNSRSSALTCVDVNIYCDAMFDHPLQYDVGSCNPGMCFVPPLRTHDGQNVYRFFFRIFVIKRRRRYIQCVEFRFFFDRQFRIDQIGIRVVFLATDDRR